MLITFVFVWGKFYSSTFFFLKIIMNAILINQKLISKMLKMLTPAKRPSVPPEIQKNILMRRRCQNRVTSPMAPTCTAVLNLLNRCSSLALGTTSSTSSWATPVCTKSLNSPSCKLFLSGPFSSLPLGRAKRAAESSRALDIDGRLPYLIPVASKVLMLNLYQRKTVLGKLNLMAR